MASEEQFEILKQGVSVWNEWRKDNPGVKIDFDGIDMRGVNLKEANFDGANLKRARLERVNLSKASLKSANLYEAGLVKANFMETNFELASLLAANLSGANLKGANLKNASLERTDLRKTDFSGAACSGTYFADSEINSTVFGNNDLSNTIGLEYAYHIGPSMITTSTLAVSRGKIPVAFLRGCGLSDWEIEAAKLYNPDLSNEEINNIQYRIYDLRATQTIQISPLFISYSHKDSPFVNRLEDALNKKGIRFWRDIHDATAGRLEKQIDRAIRHNPTVLLVLSKSSVGSDWVEHEVHLARELEKELGRDVLCPVTLDDSWEHSSWSQVLMEQVKKYYVLPFSCWEDEREFRRMFGKLVDGLGLFYKKA